MRQGGVVGPLEVVDHQQHGPARAGARRPPRGGSRAGPPSGRRPARRRPGEDRHQLGGPAARRGLAGGHRPRPVRRIGRRLRAPPPPDDHALVGGLVDQVAQQGGLADAGLAADHDGTARRAAGAAARRRAPAPASRPKSAGPTRGRGGAAVAGARPARRRRSRPAPGRGRGSPPRPPAARGRVDADVVGERCDGRPRSSAGRRPGRPDR